MRRGDEKRGRAERFTYTIMRFGFNFILDWARTGEDGRGRARTYAHVVDVFALSIGDGEDAYGGDDEEVEGGGSDDRARSWY